MYKDDSFEKLSISNSEYKVTMQPPVQWTTTQKAEKFTKSKVKVMQQRSINSRLQTQNITWKQCERSQS